MSTVTVRLTISHFLLAGHRTERDDFAFERSTRLIVFIVLLLVVVLMIIVIIMLTGKCK